MDKIESDNQELGRLLREYSASRLALVKFLNDRRDLRCAILGLGSITDLLEGNAELGNRR